MPEPEYILLHDRKAILRPRSQYDNKFRRVHVSIGEDEVQLFKDHLVTIHGDKDGFMVEFRAGDDFELVSETVDVTLMFRPWGGFEGVPKACTLRLHDITYL